MNEKEIEALLKLEEVRRENEGPAARAFRAADAQFLQALQCVMTAGTRGEYAESTFRRELKALVSAAEWRHAAKRHAEDEAAWAPLLAPRGTPRSEEP